MNAQDLTLNIAINLGRIGRWAMEKKFNRINQFMAETQEFIYQLERIPKSARFQKTFDNFKDIFNDLKVNNCMDLAWIEMTFTWANILTHRAKLA